MAPPYHVLGQLGVTCFFQRVLIYPLTSSVHSKDILAPILNGRSWQSFGKLTVLGLLFQGLLDLSPVSLAAPMHPSGILREPRSLTSLLGAIPSLSLLSHARMLLSSLVACLMSLWHPLHSCIVPLLALLPVYPACPSLLPTETVPRTQLCACLCRAGTESSCALVPRLFRPLCVCLYCFTVFLLVYISFLDFKVCEDAGGVCICISLTASLYQTPQLLDDLRRMNKLMEICPHGGCDSPFKADSFYTENNPCALTM